MYDDSSFTSFIKDKISVQYWSPEHAVSRKVTQLRKRFAGTPMGMLRLTPELQPSTGNNIFVFALPENR